VLCEFLKNPLAVKRLSPSVRVARIQEPSSRNVGVFFQFTHDSIEIGVLHKVGKHSTSRFDHVKIALGEDIVEDALLAKSNGFSGWVVGQTCGRDDVLDGDHVSMSRSGAAGAATFQVSENFHIAVEARRTASQVLADFRVASLNGLFSHPLQVRIRWTANTLWVGKRF